MPIAPNNWQLRTAAMVKSFDGVAFGEDEFVAVANAAGSETDMVMTSADRGVAWIQRTTPGLAMEWTDIWHNGLTRFVMCAESDQGGGQCAFSDDKGATWAFCASGSSFNNWNSGCYDAVNTKHICVASGNPNRCITSPTGSVWTHQAIPDAGYRGIATHHGTTIAVGDAGAIAKSTNGGSSWATKTGATSNDHQDITYHSANSRWVLISNTGTGNRVEYSDDDGETWTATAGAGDNGWLTIESGGGVLVVLSANESPQKGQYSFDGITWVYIALPWTMNFRGLAFGRSGWVGVSTSNDAGQPGASRVITDFTDIADIHRSPLIHKHEQRRVPQDWIFSSPQMLLATSQPAGSPKPWHYYALQRQQTV